MTRQEAIQTLSKVGGFSIAHAEDLYDSFFEKPVVPPCVADWYEEHKGNYDYNLWGYLTSWEYHKNNDFKEWISEDKNQPILTLVNMHQFGYTVEKEPRYTVRIKVTNQYLCNDETGPYFSPGFRTDFRKRDLEELDFGWVFDCPGVEVKEVE